MLAVLGKSSHIVDKLTEMVAMAETCWSCSLACSYEGRKTPSGAYNINPLLASVHQAEYYKNGL